MYENRILLTGGTGFIGHHLIEHIMRGSTELDPALTKICILDRLDRTSSFERLRDIETWQEWQEHISAVWHDLKAPMNRTVQDMIEERLGGHPTAILHLAASTHVDRSITNPMSFVMDNVVGTVNLLDYARILEKLTVFKPTTLIFSTDEVYGPAPGDTLYDEGDRHDPGNPYSGAKAGAESMARAYRNTYGMDILITNCMNVFGERQHPEKFFPMTMNKCLNGEVNIIHADETRTISGTRFYLHARNCADATVFALLHGRTDDQEGPGAGTYHIVGSEEVSNLDVVQKIWAIVNEIEHGIPPLYYEMVDFHSARPGHDLRYGQSGDKLRDMGFEFKLPFELSLQNMVRWYLNNRSWLDIG